MSLAQNRNYVHRAQKPRTVADAALVPRVNTVIWKLSEHKSKRVFSVTSSRVHDLKFLYVYSCLCCSQLNRILFMAFRTRLGCIIAASIFASVAHGQTNNADSNSRRASLSLPPLVDFQVPFP